MEEILQLLKRASACQEDGVFEDAYFLYLSTLEIAINYLRSVVFEKKVIIKKPRQANQLFATCQKSLSEAQTIIQTRSVNIETQVLTTQLPNQSLQTTSLKQRFDRDNKVVELCYQINTPRKRTVATKPLKRLAIVHDDFQPISVFSNENYDWSCDDSEPSTSPNSPNNDVFNATSPPNSPNSHSYQDSLERGMFSAISSPDSPNHHIHKSTTLSIPNAMILPQQTYIHIVPEGSVDPLNLVLAQVDDDDIPKNHYVPSIPKSPLLISYHTLSEKLEAINSEMVVLHNVCRKNSVQILGFESHTENEDSAMIEKVQSLNLTITETQSTLGKINNLVQLATSSTHITTFSPRLVAYQLTLIESALFQRIPPNAVLTHSPKSPHPAIVASTDFFNYLTRAIEISILLPAEASDRAEILGHWIKIASRLHDLCNFQTLKAVLSATGTPPVQRLKRTWNYVSRRTLSRLDSLRELMSEANNYGKYREITIGGDMLSDVHSLKHILPLTKPTVPFLGVFIMDVTYLLAATKNSGSTPNPNPKSTIPTPTPPTTLHTSIPCKGKAIRSNQLEEDPRVQTLLSVLRCYLAGPKYPSTPPQAFLKSKSKFFTFSTNSHSTENPARPSTYEKPINNRRKNKELDSLYTTQQVILHYLLSQSWLTERQVDEISMSREPKKEIDKWAENSAYLSTPVNNPMTATTSNQFSTEEETLWPKHNNHGIREAFGSLKQHLHFNLGHSPSRHGDVESKLGIRKPSLPNMHRIRHALGTPPAEEVQNYEFSFTTLEISSPIPLTLDIRNTANFKIPRSSKSAENLDGVTNIPRLISEPRVTGNPTIYEESCSPTCEEALHYAEEPEHPIGLLRQRYRGDHLDEEAINCCEVQLESSLACTPPTPVKSSGNNMFTKRLNPFTRTIRNITN